MIAEGSSQPQNTDSAAGWLAVAVGNSRILWGQYTGDKLREWGRLDIASNVEFERYLRAACDRICLASVGDVTAALTLWPALSCARQLDLNDVPLANTYATLGLDRALAVVGAARKQGWPVLVVDGGTALTLTAVDELGAFAGGAIVPGLRLQRQSLFASTAALPTVREDVLTAWPIPRWACETEAAIQSGIIYGAIATIRAFCQDWRFRYPDGSIVFTGGDGEFLHYVADIPHSNVEPTLVLQGMAACR
ncbi:MAG: type III pantothenate kinase [Cyanobacteria bacterium J06642_2]